MKFRLTSICLLLLLGSCGDNVLPKPKAMLRLQYPEGEYLNFEGDCSYAFEINQLAEPKSDRGCSMVLNYPAIKGAIYITYKPVENNNLKNLLIDAQRLSYEHVVKADNIIEQPFIDQDKRVFGMFYEVRGNAASQSQFYATDSTRHFVTGSLYFHAKPNYDSIYPAAMYLQQDIRRIIESLEWR